jgi:hypothetical protein
VAEVADALFGASSEFLPGGRMRRGDTDVVVDLFSAARGKRLSRAVLDGLVDARCL